MKKFALWIFFLIVDTGGLLAIKTFPILELWSWHGIFFMFFMFGTFPILLILSGSAFLDLVFHLTPNTRKNRLLSIILGIFAAFIGFIGLIEYISAPIIGGGGLLFVIIGFIGVGFICVGLIELVARSFRDEK